MIIEFYPIIRVAFCRISVEMRSSSTDYTAPANGPANDRRSRGRPDGAGAAGGGASGCSQPDVLGIELALPRFDLSLAKRRATRERDRPRGGARDRDARARAQGGDGDAGGRGDVGSPNRILREDIGGRVIVRTGRRIPGVAPRRRRPLPDLRRSHGRRRRIRAKEWREGEGDDEVAFRTERIERRVCRAVAEFSFRQAERMGAKVFGGPKYTVSPVYEGMLKEEMDAAAARHPDVPYEPQLIDATFALLISSSGAPMVIPALNRDGDILSDLVLPLFGSIAGSESLLVAFGDEGSTARRPSWPRLPTAPHPHSRARTSRIRWR